MDKTVIIGNSAAGLAALESFRKYDPRSPVTLITAETKNAYSRVLLPYYLRGQIPYSNLFIRGDEFYSRMNTEVLYETSVEGVDLSGGSLRCVNGKKLSFDKMLIATGANPVKPPIKGLSGPGIHHLWTLKDVEDLNSLFFPGKRVLILGSGFVALQAGWAALTRGCTVSVFELMDRIMPRVLDTAGADFLRKKIEDHRVGLYTGIMTREIERTKDGSFRVITDSRPPLEADIIIVGTGVRPNTDFLEEGALEMNRGILLNDRMETSVPGIYAAGDVALCSSVFGETHVSHALWPTAVEHGKIAGANMAGKDFRYRGSLNMNVTEMFSTVVASMGNFQDDEESREHPFTGKTVLRDEQDKKEDTYLKIQWHEGKPQGGVLIGPAEMVPLFGALRAIIREGKNLGADEKLCELARANEIENMQHYFRLKAGEKRQYDPTRVFQNTMIKRKG